MTLRDTGDWHAQGCRRTCSEQHTYTWGDCALATPQTRPEPCINISKVFTDTDGHKSIGFDTYTVDRLADLIEPALRDVNIRLDLNALAMLQRGEPVRLSGGEYTHLARAAAHALIHRNDNPEDAS